MSASEDVTIFIPGHAPIMGKMRLPQIAPPIPAIPTDGIHVECEFTLHEREPRSPEEERAGRLREAVMEMTDVIAGIALSRGDQFTFHRAKRLYQKAAIDQFWDDFGRRS